MFGRSKETAPIEKPEQVKRVKLQDLLEKDKQAVLNDLTRVKTTERAPSVIETELDKLLLRYNEGSDSERAREAAAHMLHTLRIALPLMDSVDETKVWEIKNEDAKVHRLTGLSLILLIIGIVVAVVAILFYGKEIPFVNLEIKEPMNYYLICGGMAAMFFSGVTFMRPVGRVKPAQQQVEIIMDPNEVYAKLRTAVLAIDQNLTEVQSQEKWEKRTKPGEMDGHQLSAQEIDIFADLLAAAYSADGEFALEKIDDLKYYLHKQGMDILDYSTENQAYFDVMPAQENKTLRPALVMDGTVLKKGMATKGR